jgi:cell division protein FtsZ
MIFELLKDESPIIKVIGVGGGGSNAVTHMFKQGIVGVDFAICNTDSQSMEISPVPTRIQLGPNLTEGRGAGSKPNIGKLACEESLDDIRRYLTDNCKMLFVTAGMGGGTGTGAAPMIARTAQEMDILTVGIVTVPFTFEGRRRAQQAMDGLEELKKHVDTLIIISNDKLRQIHGNLKLSDAFSEADDILTTAARGIAEIITVPGYVNVDFEDVNTVMRNSGVAIMGTAIAEGDNRAKRAVDDALNSPLLEDNNIKGAQHILLNITSGTKEVTMDEIFEITEFVQEEAGYGTDLIWGNCYDERLGEAISVTIIATGFERHQPTMVKDNPREERIVVHLDEEQKKTDRKPFQAELKFDKDEDEQPKTIEFHNLQDNISKINRHRFSYNEPYLKDEERTRQEAEQKRHREIEMQRRERLRNTQLKLTNPQNVVEMENEPAYMRRGVHLEDIPHSAEPALSRWTISEEEEPELRENNAYLHDKPD